MPPPPKPGFTGLQVALRVGVPVFVPPLAPAVRRLEWSAQIAADGAIHLSAQNTGNTHVQVTDFELGVPGASEPLAHQTALAYVLAGQRRLWVLPVPPIASRQSAPSASRLLPMPARSTPRSTSSARHAVLWALLMLAATGPANAQPSAPERAPPLLPALLAPDASDEELLLQVDLNAQGLTDTVLVLRSADGKIAVPVDSLDRWRLRRPDVAPRFHDGTPYYSLDAIAGVTYTYDAAKQRLTIAAPPRAFTDTRFANAAVHYPAPTPSQLGGFFNYNLFASRASGESQYAGQFEAGVFSPYGVLIAGLLAQDNAGVKETVRLGTTWTSDFPAQLTTLRLGDATNVPGAWGRAVQFGGVHTAPISRPSPATSPFLRSPPTVGEIAIAVDCSGSVNSRQLGLFQEEIRSILAGQRPSLVHVLYFDAAVQKVETYQAGEPISLVPVGGGGTDFRPCFDWLREQGIVPATLVFLTDLCGTTPSEPPPYPVIWASTENRRAPFGQVVSMEAA